MIELFEQPPTRSNRAKWALEEIGADYKTVPVDLERGEQDSPAYRAIHPLGVVPAIRTPAYAMFESVAIVMQLLDENPKAQLAPPIGTPERASYYQWCVFGAAEVDRALMAFFDNAMRPPEGMRPPGSKRAPETAEKGRYDFGVCAEALSNVIGDRPYLIGDAFSGADIVIGHSCFMATHMGLLEDYPILVRYFSGLSERPAHRRAYGA